MVPTGKYEGGPVQLGAIKRAALVEKTMPQDGPLTPRQYKILSQWISKGASENAEPQSPPHHPDPVPQPPQPPPPTPVPVVPTFESIKTQIFSGRCFMCHSRNGSASRVPLSSVAEIIESPLELVLPGYPDESGIVIAIERKDSKRMPPPEAGQSLTIAEIQAIRDWIKNGAKD